MAQFARPDSNITQTGMTGGATAIDELVASDADFAYSADNTSAVLEVGLSNAADPNVGTGHVFRYRIARTKSGVVDGTGSDSTVVAELYQGTTLIAADTSKIATGTWTTYALTLTSTQADSITNYSDLRLRFTISGGGGSPSNRRGLGISWAELEVPAAVSTLSSDTYRARNDDGSEASATWKVAENTAWNQNAGETFRLRIALLKADGPNPQTITVKLQCRVNGGSWVDVGSGQAVELDTSSFVTGGEGTNDRLTNTPGFFNHALGDIVDAGHPTGTAGLSNSGDCEHEFVLLLGASAVVDDVIEFRMVESDGTVLSSYLQTPQLTVVVSGTIATAGFQTFASSTFAGSAAGKALTTGVLQSLVSSVFSANASAAQPAEALADLQVMAVSALAGTSTGQALVSPDVASLVTSLFAGTATGKASVTSGLIGASTATYNVVGTGQGAVSAALMTVPASLLGPSATGAGRTEVTLLVTATGLLDAEALGKAVASSELSTVGVTAFSASAGVLARITAALLSLSGSVLDVSPSGAAEAAATLSAMAMTLLAADATGASLVNASLMAAAASVFAAVASGGGNVTPDLLTASAAVLMAAGAGAAVANGSTASVGVSVFAPNANGGAGATANADLISLGVSAFAPGASGSAEAAAALLNAVWTAASVAVGGGESAQATADLLSMTASQFDANGKGAAFVVPGVAGTSLSVGDGIATGAASTTAALQALTWSQYAAGAGGGIAAIANAALLALSIVLSTASATGAALGLPGIATVLSEALNATVSAGAMTEAAEFSLGVTVFSADALGDAHNFEGTARVAFSLVAVGDVDWSLSPRERLAFSMEGAQSLEVAA